MSITPLDPANFNPTLKGIKRYGAFRFWCQQVLPLTFDDSLSYYELLNKLVDFLNKTMENVNDLGTDVESLGNAYEQLENYVNTYFSSLDVQTEINNKLDEMALDDSEHGLSALIAPFIPALVTEWLQANVTPVGSAVVVNPNLNVSGAAADALAVRNKSLLKLDSDNASGQYPISGTTDLNTDFDTQAIFTSIGNPASSKPINSPYWVEGEEPSESGVCFFAHFNSGLRWQFYYNNVTTELYGRYKTGGATAAWTSWKKIFNKEITKLDNLVANFNSLLDDFSVFKNHIIPEYSNELTYAYYDYCIHNNKIYYCTLSGGITEPEEFTSSHWTEGILQNKTFMYTTLPNGTDLNEFLGECVAGIGGYSSVLINCPDNSPGLKYLLSIGSANICTQIFVHCLTGKMYTRYASGSPITWHNWVEVGNKFPVIVDNYSNAQKYSYGDCVLYNNIIYKCTTPVREPEDFNSGKWEATNILKIFNDKFIRTNVVRYEEKQFENTTNNGVLFKLLDYNVAKFNNNTEIGLYSKKDKYYNFKRLLYEFPVDCVCVQENVINIDNVGGTGGSLSAKNYLFSPIYPAYKGSGPSFYAKVGGNFRDFVNITDLPVEDSEETTSVTVRRNKLVRDNTELYVYTFLLAAVSNWKVRKAQLKGLIDACLAADNPTNYVFVGDFNTGTLTNDYVDEEVAFLKSLESTYNCTLANGSYMGWIRTHHSSLFGALDNALVSNTCVIEKFIPLGEWYPSLYSDHYPVLLDIRVQTE